MTKRTIIEPGTMLALQVGLLTEADGGVLLIADDGSAEGIYYPVPPFIVHDGVPPDERPGHWCLVDSVWEPAIPPDPIELANTKSRLTNAIDDLIASVYARWTRFESEYVTREGAARAFVAAGYTGDPGLWITSFAEPAGLEVAAAANLIVGQADQLRAAQEQLGALRMQKYTIHSATTADAAQAAHDVIVNEVKDVVAGLQ
jgi:hypothetical protein